MIDEQAILDESDPHVRRGRSATGRVGEYLRVRDVPEVRVPVGPCAVRGTESLESDRFSILAEVARLLLAGRLPTSELLGSIGALLRSAFRRPERIAVRVVFDGEEAATPGFGPGRDVLATEFTGPGDERGAIEVVSLEADSQDGFVLEDQERPLVEAVGGLLRDYFDREVTDRAMRLNEARLQQIADQMLDMVVQVDPARSVRYASPATLATLGYPAEAFLGRMRSKSSTARTGSPPRISFRRSWTGSMACLRSFGSGRPTAPISGSKWSAIRSATSRAGSSRGSLPPGTSPSAGKSRGH